MMQSIFNQFELCVHLRVKIKLSTCLMHQLIQGGVWVKVLVMMLLVANKADKVIDADAAADKLKKATGLPTVLVSGQTGLGIEQLKLLLQQLSPASLCHAIS